MPVYNQVLTPDYSLYHGDSVEILADLPSNSIDYIIFSPPFSSLYTYSDSEHDHGNCRGDAEFFTQYRFLSTELFRVLKPGRLMSVHCMMLPYSKQNTGHLGLNDFPGHLRQHHEEDGFLLHSHVTIWKDPVMQMQRTKSIGLLYKQVRKDATISRQGLPDFVYTFVKPGINPDPVTHASDDLPLERWQRYASPVWMDINPSDTLQRTSAREDADERHIAPLQLQVIERCIDLWTNPGDIVLDPYGGIGSTPYVAVRMERKAVACELKASYYRQMVANCAQANAQLTLQF